MVAYSGEKSGLKSKPIQPKYAAFFNYNSSTTFGYISVLAHIYLAWIHPFGDGNGRTARLVEFQILLAAGVPTIASHLLSNHYNQTRSEYYRLLGISSKGGGTVYPFFEYAAAGMRDGLDKQISEIRKHLAAVAWKDHVYTQFKGRETKTALRQRKLALALGARRSLRTVPQAGIRHFNSEMAEAYAGFTNKTISRDLKALKEMGLVVIQRRGAVRAKHEILQKLLPKRRKIPRQQ